MKIMFYTYDFCYEREHLMPWRTILEVAKSFFDDGNDVQIINACYDDSMHVNYNRNGIIIKAISPGYEYVVDYLKNENSDVLFFPFSWRDGLKKISVFRKLNCLKIGYMPGGIYDLNSVYTLCRYGGKRFAKSYLLECLVPKSFLVKKVKKAGFKKLICMTDLTASYAKRAGFEDIVSIPPGKDNVELIKSNDNIVQKYGLYKKKWLLFSGAPAETRGVELLLKAIDKVQDNSIRLVLLMRTDAGSRYGRFEKVLGNMSNPERVIILKEKLTREQLFAFFRNAWYAFLPFIVIPSEIPLTFFELLSCGTPVVTFENGGTTDFLREPLVISSKNVRGLRFTIQKIWNDDGLRKEKHELGVAFMEKHLGWTEVVDKWKSLID